MDKLLFRKYLFTDSNTDTYSRMDARFAFSVVMLKLLLTAIVATLSLIGVSKTIESFGYSYFAFYEMTLVISVLLFVDGFIDMIKMLKSMGRIQATQFDWIRKTLVLTTSISMLLFFLNFYFFDRLIPEQFELVYFVVTLIIFISATVYMVYKTYLNNVQAIIQIVVGVVLTYMYFAVMSFSFLINFFDL